MTTPRPSPEAVDPRPYTTAAQIVERHLANPPQANLAEREETWREWWERRFGVGEWARGQADV